MSRWRRRWWAISLHSSANIVSAGVRAIPVGQTDGQRTIAALAPDDRGHRGPCAGRRARRSRRGDDAGRHRQHETRNPIHEALPLMTSAMNGPLRVGVGGPVGSGKTALMDALCKALRDALRHRRHHQRHLHQGGRRVPHPLRRAAPGPHPRRRDRRLPAHRDPRGRLDQPRRGRRAPPALPQPRPGPHRIRRRQPRRHLLAGARRSHHLRHRRLGRRQDPAQGRAGHHPLGPARHQQDRPRADGRRLARGDGPRRPEDARRRGPSSSPT